MLPFFFPRNGNLRIFFDFSAHWEVALSDLPFDYGDLIIAVRVWKLLSEEVGVGLVTVLVTVLKLHPAWGECVALGQS